MAVNDELRQTQNLTTQVKRIAETRLLSLLKQPHVPHIIATDQKMKILKCMITGFVSMQCRLHINTILLIISK